MRNILLRTYDFIVMKNCTTSNSAQTWVTDCCDIGTFFDIRWRPCVARQPCKRVIPCQVIQQNGDFSSDPHQNSRNFVRGKISGFWAQQSRSFWNWTCISEFMSIWNFDVFQDDWTKNFSEFAVGTSTDSHSFMSEYFHSIFRRNAEGSMLNKTTQKVCHWWPLNSG